LTFTFHTFIENYNDMEQNINLKVLKCIERVYELAEDCKLEDSFFVNVNNELTVLSKYFSVSKMQALFISIVFAHNFKRNGVDIDNLSRHFDCNPIKLLHYIDELNLLRNRGILKKSKSKYNFENDQYTVNKVIIEAILQDCPMPEKLSEEINDILDLLQKIYSLEKERDNKEITSGELFIQTAELLDTYNYFLLVQKINQLNLNTEDAYLYLYLIWKTVTGSDAIDLGSVMEGIYEKPQKRVNYMTELYSGENNLLKLNLIGLHESSFFNNTVLKLTEQSIILLKENGITLFKQNKKKENIINHEDIPYKELFFSKEEMSQIFTIKELLQETKFSETQQRLVEKKLPKGINVILHGLPGAGKTEIVKQLAKESGRDIMKVEISQSKSMWFGESEKIIKRIFTDYKTFAKECSKTPILLFNEADAILSKRKDTSSNVGQTENAIQNILLEELENFEGILIATTNLIDNLDKAFERRFLFKIEFRKPDISIKAKIWKSKLSCLSSEESILLAEKFDFTGGQIDNIYRKAEIHEIINGSPVKFKDILKFCEEETLVQKVSKIGFM
jgi:AAA+ superfamily predicted ATPase